MKRSTYAIAAFNTCKKNNIHVYQGLLLILSAKYREFQTKQRGKHEENKLASHQTSMMKWLLSGQGRSIN